MGYKLRLISTRNRKTLENSLAAAGVAWEGVDILASKAFPSVVRVDGIGAPAANILKQQMLSLGGDAAVHRDVITGEPETSSVFLIGCAGRFALLAEKLKKQPFGLASLGGDALELLRSAASPPRSISLPSGAVDLSEGPVIMGVLNVTPDSFSDGGIYLEPSAALDRALEMIDEGAAIIDVGGESTRPGARHPGAEEERSRIIPVIEKLSAASRIPISVDTRNSVTARAAVDSGASIINDISGLRHDPQMHSVARESGAAVVIMHMQGTPETMQNDPHYEDAVSEIIDWLDETAGGLEAGGIARDKIIVDPGIGFGKRLNDNFEIIDQAASFHTLGFPVLIGYSRKSFLGAITGRDAGGRIWGGMAILGRCLDAGVEMVRVHDVRETSDFIKVWKAAAGGKGKIY